MPDEVFDIWIAPLIKDYGWPFSKDSISSYGTKWQYFFPVSFSFWRNIHWEFRKDIHDELFEGQTLRAIQDIIGNCALGLTTDMTNLCNTHERFRACTDFIRNNNRLPAPVIGFITTAGICIVDGAHRLSAMVHLQAIHIEIPAWIGINEKQ